MHTILILPLIAMAIAQIAKFFIRSNSQKHINLKALASYSGMPSAHSALVTALATITGLKLGFDSPAFAMAFFLAIIVIRDAVGIRQYLGQHGKILNVLVKDLKDDQMLDYKYPHLLERIGHTPTQVLIGALIGFFVSLIGYYIF